MSSVAKTEQRIRTPRTSPLVAWGLLAGGAFFFLGGSLHPKQDPPDVTLKEHLHIMFEDPMWYPAHVITLVGMALIAASLVLLVRGRSLAGVPRAHAAAVVAAVASAAAALGMVLHLAAALESDRIAAHESTALVDVNLIVETITVPFFGFSIATLAVVGAMTRTLGGWVAAPFGVIGGVGFGLAGGTFLLTDKLDPLFPLAAGIALWAMAAGIGLLLHARASRLAPLKA